MALIRHFDGRKFARRHLDASTTDRRRKKSRKRKEENALKLFYFFLQQKQKNEMKEYFAQSAWHSGYRVRLQNRRSRV
jgi:hypothetical protein